MLKIREEAKSREANPVYIHHKTGNQWYSANNTYGINNTLNVIILSKICGTVPVWGLSYLGNKKI